MPIRKIFIAIAVIGIAYYLYTSFMSHGGGWGQQGGAAPVSVAQVIERKIREWHEFSGRLVAVDQAEVRPRVSGIIDTVHFTDGTLVSKGDALFTIDPRPFAAEVTRTEGLLGSAEAQLVLTRAELKRAEKLIGEKAIPQHEYDQHRNDFNVAEANVKSAKAALDVAQLNLDYTIVKAPITGRVSRAEITTGNLVEAGNSAPVLTTVVASTPIYADFEIDEATFLEYAHAGITGNKNVSGIPVMMALTGETGAPHTGHIESFDNRLNSASGTVRVRTVFDNADGVLMPGLFAHIKLGGAKETQALLITDRAVGTDQSKKFVLVVGDDNKVVYREVKLGMLADGLRVVNEGLKPGEKIIVNGLQRARPGSEVTPEVVPMEKADDVKPVTDDKKQDEKKPDDTKKDKKP